MTRTVSDVLRDFCYPPNGGTLAERVAEVLENLLFERDEARARVKELESELAKRDAALGEASLTRQRKANRGAK